jgi:hypothetical protein
MVSDFLEGLQLFHANDQRLTQRSMGSSTLRVAEMQCTGPDLQGPLPSINSSMRALGIRYKGSGVQGFREHGNTVRGEYGNCANRTLTSYMAVAKSHRTSKPRTARATSRLGRNGRDEFCLCVAHLSICLMSAAAGGNVHTATIMLIKRT